ncbi:cupin domain-containing protein [Thalassotalea litorea]|uniref:cupin domain-containing protein n=1 Tax=Thalassotalea litorea TaxID=2020715 RepID=UPI003736B8E0
MSNEVKIYSTLTQPLATEADELSADMFESAIPTQHTQEFFSDEERGIYVGLWDTTSMRETAGPYPMEEFMVVLEGKADIALATGSMRQVQTDEGFVIPHGTDCQWQQQGYLKKLFVIVDNPTICPSNAQATDIQIFGPNYNDVPYVNEAKSFSVYSWSEFTHAKRNNLRASLAAVYCQQGCAIYQSAASTSDAAQNQCQSAQVMLIEQFNSENLNFLSHSSGYVVLINISDNGQS